MVQVANINITKNVLFSYKLYIFQECKRGILLYCISKLQSSPKCRILQELHTSPTVEVLVKTEHFTNEAKERSSAADQEKKARFILGNLGEVSLEYYILQVVRHINPN